MSADGSASNRVLLPVSVATVVKGHLRTIVWDGWLVSSHFLCGE